MRRLPLLTALAVLGLLLACNGGGGGLLTAMPTPSPIGTPAAPRATTPRPPATQAPSGPAQPVVLEEGAPVTEGGSYVVEVSTGRVWWLHDQGGLWSPDGKALVSSGCCIGKGGLDVIDIAAGQAVRLYSGDVNGAAWSPDGAQIAFSPAGGSLSPGLCVINRDGSELRRVWGLGAGSVQWSPAGDRIAYWSWERTYLLDIDSGQVTELGDGGNQFVIWSIDGRWIAFSGENGVRLYEANTGERRQFEVASGDTAGEEPGRHAFATWSPAETALAYADGSGLYIYRPDTSDVRQVAVGPSAWPIWSPDGSRIIFRFGPEVPFPLTPEVGVQAPYVVEVKGDTEPKPLPMASTVSWFPDGSHIAYLDHGCVTGGWDIYKVASDGGSAVPLTNTPKTVKEGPFWSPTGATIAFSTFGELMLMDVESGELRTLAVSGGEGSYSPGIHLHGSPWSPDGRYIEFGAGGAHGICD